MTQEANISIPRWFLEVVEDTLRIENNINLDKKTVETCQDRNIRQSLNGIRKLLNGEELTGMERFEKLQPSLPSNLDEVKLDTSNMTDCGYKAIAEYYFNLGKKAGAKWMARQGASFKVNVEEVPQGHWYSGLHLGGCSEEEENALKSINAKDGEEVIVQIRKKQ